MRVSLAGVRRSTVVLAYCLLVSGAILPPLLAPAGTAGSVDLEVGLPALQFALASVLLITLLALMNHFWRRGVLRWTRDSALPIVFAAFALVSLVWSANPDLTFRRGVALAGTVVFAIFLNSVVGYGRSIRLITIFMAIVVVLSFFVAVMFPDFGVHQAGSHSGRWKGVYFHKNLLGRETALATGFFVLAALNTRSLTRRLVWWGVLLVAIVLLIAAESATGSATAVVVIAVAILLRQTRHRPYMRALAILGAMASLSVVAIIGLAYPRAIVGLLGRDISLTGRTDLWSRILESIAESPLIGHGYRAFWGSGGGAQISSDLGWRVTHAHNGWLAVGLDLGLIGILLTLALLLGPALKALRVRRMTPEIFEYGSVVAVAALSVSVSDSVFLGPNNLFVLLMMTHFIAANRASRPATVGEYGRTPNTERRS